MPRYHGYGLIEPDERSAFADNRGGTANFSSLRLFQSRAFFVLEASIEADDQWSPLQDATHRQIKI